MDSVSVGAVCSHWCYKPVPHWSTIKSRSPKWSFYKVYLRMLILNLGILVSDFLVHMFVRDVNGSRTWVVDFILGPCRPKMCSSQPKNDKKMENNSRIGTLSGIGIVETNLSMKSNKLSLFGGFQIWMLHFGVLLCRTIWKGWKMRRVMTQFWSWVSGQ